MESLLAFLLLLAAVAQADLIINGTSLGRRFDGIGGLSAGASSRHLVSYDEPYRTQILDYLFLPNFGASLQILKVEIGGDCQSTDGTESSHMHDQNDLNYERGYEWWLMSEAKKRNPNILISALEWCVPGWMGEFFSQDNIDYQIKFLEGAKSVYGLDIDYAGVWNERSYSADWIVQFRKALDQNGFNSTKIVAPDDFGWDIVGDLQSNAAFKAAVDIVGTHYPGTYSSPAARTGLEGMPLWASEDYSTYADEIGGGCWGRTLNQNFVNGYMTATIAWALIAAYDVNLPFAGTGLMWAYEPWSGNYEVNSPIWISAHTTQFTQPGWIYLAQGSGSGLLPSGGSYVTLVPPSNTGDFTLIVETFSHDHSVCIRPDLPAYNVSAQNVTFQLAGGLEGSKTLYVWYSHLVEGGNSTYFEQIQSISPENGQFTVQLGIDEIFTITTTTGQKKGSYPPPPASAPFPMMYTDDFEVYPLYQEANYFMDQTGVWEIRQGNATNKVMRQVVLQSPIVWVPEAVSPISLVGNYANDDVMISIDILIEEAGGTAAVGTRAYTTYNTGYFFSIADTGAWVLTVGPNVTASGTVQAFQTNVFYNVQMQAIGPKICVSVNEVQLACINDATFKQGYCAIGSGWNYAQFDNLVMEAYNPTFAAA